MNSIVIVVGFIALAALYFAVSEFFGWTYEIDAEPFRDWVEDRGIDPGPVAWGPRIGIRVAVEHPWRVWVAGNPAVSGKGGPSTAICAVPPTPSARRPGPAGNRGSC